MAPATGEDQAKHKKLAGCCAEFDWREPVNPETNVARMGWDALLSITVIYTVMYTVYELIFVGSENMEYDST